MSKTYAELLDNAELMLDGFDMRNGEYASATCLYAIACILLAQEKRLAKESEQYDT